MSIPLSIHITMSKTGGKLSHCRPTWIYEIDHMCMYGYKFGLSSTCGRMSYMNLRNRPNVYVWIQIWFIFYMQPYVLHESTESTKCVFMDTNLGYLQHAAYVLHESTRLTICVFMDTNLGYLQHAAICPTWIYEIDYMCIYGY